MSELSKKYDESLFKRGIVEENERCVEIYKITCLENNKAYVGQTVSHILNTGKYRRYGMERRLRGHISEAFSKKKNQCHYLNNSIRKYGADKFEVELLDTCALENSDKLEEYYIKEHKTMFPNGYNLKFGTVTTRLSEEGKQRVSDGVYRFYKDKKFERFKDVKIIDDDISKYIRPLNRNKQQYGWYVYIQTKKADFGGLHIPLETSRKNAEEFIQELKNKIQQDTLMRETP
jgi:group I intron endonuclease